MTRKEVIELALQALKGAPHKHRIDFDPYWWWYEDSCVKTIAVLEKELESDDKIPAKQVGVGPTTGLL